MARNNKSSNSSSKNSSKNSNNNNNYNNNIIVVIINKKRKTFCTQWLTIPKQRKTYKNINIFLSPSHTKANRNLHKKPLPSKRYTQPKNTLICSQRFPIKDFCEHKKIQLPC